MSRNGTVVAGFGGMHLNPAWSQFYDEKEPLRIYVDGQVAYENDDIWLFDVADNGGSYFFIGNYVGKCRNFNCADYSKLI